MGATSSVARSSNSSNDAASASAPVKPRAITPPVKPRAITPPANGCVLESWLGDELLAGASGGRARTADLCSGRVVGLYFSAHWCPPCRGFTPRLAASYNTLKAANKAVEIVFISSDQDQKSFDNYFGEMPWTALDFNDRARKQALSERFGVRGIPSLVFVDGDTGRLITKDGRAEVMRDPENWAGVNPTTLTGDADADAAASTPESGDGDGSGAADILGPSIIAGDGSTVATADLCKGKTIGIYFSAHWCPPCRRFTPKLAETYRAQKKLNKQLEIVFVSSDQNESSFNDYFNEMPWHAVDFADRDRKQALGERFEVSGIPSLIFIDGDSGKTLTTVGRDRVMTGDFDGLF